MKDLISSEQRETLTGVTLVHWFYICHCTYQISFRVDIIRGRGGVPQCWTNPPILNFTSNEGQSLDKQRLKRKWSWQLWLSDFLCTNTEKKKVNVLRIQHSQSRFCLSFLKEFCDDSKTVSRILEIRMEQACNWGQCGRISTKSNKGNWHLKLPVLVPGAR